MVFEFISAERVKPVRAVVGWRLLAAGLTLLVWLPCQWSSGQEPSTFQPPSFDSPDPLQDPDATDPGFELTQPFDLTTPLDGNLGGDLEGGALSTDVDAGAGPSGPARGPVTSSLDEPEDPHDELVPGIFDKFWADGPVLPPNECSRCAIGTCSGHYRWYGSLDYLSLHRSRPNGVGFSVVFNATFGIFVNSLSTDNLVFAFEPGARATIGRCLGTDCKNRDHSIEISYTGVNEWEERFVSDSGNGASLISKFFAVSNVSTVFDGADRHDIHYVGDFNSFQLDYKIKRRLDKDRMVFRPEGTWHREAWPGWVPSVYFGVRNVNINEDFQFQATTTGAVNSNGLYTSTTRNNLVGLHAGGELLYQAWQGSVGIRGGAAGMTNFMEVFGGLTSVSDTVPGDNFSVRNDVKDQDMAVVGDFSVIGNYRVGKQLTLRIAYNMIWVGGIALAPEQFTFNVNEPIQLKRQGFTFYQGFSFGGEFVW